VGKPVLRIYFLERPLSNDEATQVAEDLETPIEQVRIPHVLPVPEAHHCHQKQSLDADSALALLRRAGIVADTGVQVGLVAPIDRDLYEALVEAVYIATGSLPYVIQTAEQREAIGNRGPLRVLDAQGLRGWK
jgi:hypothetical protein